MADLNDYLKKIEEKKRQEEELRLALEMRRRQEEIELHTEHARNACFEEFDKIVMDLVDWGNYTIENGNLYFPIDIFGNKSLLFVVFTHNQDTYLAEGDHLGTLWRLKDIDKLIMWAVAKVRNEKQQ